MGRYFDWEAATRDWACVVAAPGPSNSTATLAPPPRTLAARGGSPRAKKTGGAQLAKKISGISCGEERTCVESRTVLLAQVRLGQLQHQP